MFLKEVQSMATGPAHKNGKDEKGFQVFPIPGDKDLAAYYDLIRAQLPPEEVERLILEQTGKPFDEVITELEQRGNLETY
jgi:hypothetical protein